MNGLEKVKFVLDIIQDELYMTKSGMPCKLFFDSFLGKIKHHDLANIITRLEYEKVLRIIELPTSDSNIGYFSIEVLPGFQDYMTEIKFKLGNPEPTQNSGFIYSKNRLILNGKTLLQNHQGSSPDKLFKILWDNKRIIRNGKVLREGNRITTKKLTAAAGYDSEQSTMDRIGFFNQKLATNQESNSAKIENEKGSGYLLILKTDSEVREIIIE